MGLGFRVQGLGTWTGAALGSRLGLYRDNGEDI